MSKFVVKDLSEMEANRVVRLYKADGCSTDKMKQVDGKWQVVATCPDSVEEK